MIVRIIYSIVCMLVVLSSYQELNGSDDIRQIELNLRNLTPANARGYLMPLMESYAANISRSTFHTAEIRKGIVIYIGMKAIVAIIPDEYRTFPAESPYSNSTERTATVVGNQGNGDFPDGFNWKVVPVMIPQMNVGNIFGTQFFVRYLPSTKFDDKIGTLDVIGGGITHSLSQYLPSLPLNFAVQGVYQYAKLGDIFESTGTVYNFLASTRFAGLTLYGGLGYENTDLNVRYYYSPRDEQMSASDETTNRITFTESFEEHFRATVGMSLQFIIFNLNADYSFGDIQVATVGLGVSI